MSIITIGIDLANNVFAVHGGCARMDKPKVVTAAAHKLARLIYTMLSKSEEYTGRGQDDYEKRYRERVLRQLAQGAEKTGTILVENQQPA